MSSQSFFFRLHHALSYSIPTVVRSLLSHLLGVSQTSSIWDFRTALVVAIVRALFNDPVPVSMLEGQRSNNNNVEDVVIEAIRGLGGQIESDMTEEVLARPVKGEWVGHRSGAEDASDLDNHKLSEDQKYVCLTEQADSDVLFLFLHGGQFYLRNPASRRAIVHALAQKTSGRCFSVSYRLSPQHVFPAALLDLMVVYLSILYPSPGSRHAATPATSICLSGDSSGANIALAFLQLILYLQRKAPSGVARVVWHGRDVLLPFPAAVATHSGYFDLTRSLPSESTNLPFDVLPPPKAPPSPRSKFVQDAIWPASPPRHHVYTSTALLTHPLVSPVTALDWSSCPTSIWLSVGQECLADGSIVIAKRMAEQGVQVTLEVYEGMPHDFLVMLISGNSGQQCLESWAEFARAAVAEREGDAQKGPKSREESKGVIRHVNGETEYVDLAQIEPQRTVKEIVEGMRAQIVRWGDP